jgi:hypothetical protein
MMFWTKGRFCPQPSLFENGTGISRCYVVGAGFANPVGAVLTNPWCNHTNSFVTL